MSRLRILFVVSECVPLAKTGGLGDVAGALPLQLRRRGHDVRVLMPRYRATESFPARRLDEPLAVQTGLGEHWNALWEGRLEGEVPIYLLEHDALFDRDGIYGDLHGEFGDNLLRFTLLSRAAFALEQYLGFQPHIFHAHDWPSALVPVYARQFAHPAATVLTIHNLGYQGRFPREQLPVTGLPLLPELDHWGAINLLKAGICTADFLTTVSPRYASEIQSSGGGAGLDGELRDRGSALLGIQNGIDDKAWDPASDPHLAAPFSSDSLAGKALCKAALQREMGLPIRADIPLFGVVSRFVEQKGIDLFASALDQLLHQDIQVAVLGSGDAWTEQRLAELSRAWPNLRAQFGFNEGLAHRIEAGSDLFVMPSRYEPCGLNQMYSQRYGTVPIVRNVGGLADSVEDGVTGLLFEELSVAGVTEAVLRAAELYRQRPQQLKLMQQNGMSKRMGWDRAAAHYEALYRLAIARKAH